MSSNIYLAKNGNMYHEDCMDDQDKVGAALVTDIDGDDNCEECGKPLLDELYPEDES